MKIKEIANKYSLILFYTTIILTILLVISLTFNISNRRYDYKDRDRFDNKRGGMMRNDKTMNMNKHNMNMDNRPMMNIENNTNSSTNTPEGIENN